MVRSMTGYGKSECLHGNIKFIVEVRSLNGKSADISLKTSLIPREKELEVRQLLSQSLQRGNIDLFVSIESNATENSKVINREVFKDYHNQIKSLQEELKEECSLSDLYSSILKMPDVIDVKKQIGRAHV